MSVRSQQYRLDNEGALFDMETDPGQTRDVAGERPDEAARLAKAAAQWSAEIEALHLKGRSASQRR